VAREVCAMVANKPDPRDAILDRFEKGWRTKEQADAEAVAAGFPSMERRPDFAGADCRELPRWTMPQLMAWVIYRSSIKVLELSEEYRMQTLIWQSEDLLDAWGQKIETTWRLRPPDKLSVYDVVVEAYSREGSEGRSPSAIELWKELGGQFLRGELTAYGKKRGDDEPSAIPRTAWAEIDLFDQPCNHFDPEDIGRENEKTARYFDVYVIPKDVLSIRPPIGSESGGTQTEAAEALRIRQAEIDAGQAAQQVEIERLKAIIKTKTEDGRRGHDTAQESVRDRLLEFERDASRLRDDAVKALAAMGNRSPLQKDIANWMRQHWDSPWDIKKRNESESHDRPSLSTLKAFLSKHPAKK
jgi:hypothetical protein